MQYVMTKSWRDRERWLVQSGTVKVLVSSLRKRIRINSDIPESFDETRGMACRDTVGKIPGIVSIPI